MLGLLKESLSNLRSMYQQQMEHEQLAGHQQLYQNEKFMRTIQEHNMLASVAEDDETLSGKRGHEVALLESASDFSLIDKKKTNGALQGSRRQPMQKKTMLGSQLSSGGRDSFPNMVGQRPPNVTYNRAMS
jgi:hypothetical protein